MIKGLLFLAGLAVCRAQAPAPEAARPVLENQGKPMRLAFACSEDDVAALGLTCTLRQPCPVYLELSSLETVGNRLIAVGNLHTESATLASVLLATDDAGRTWYEGYHRIPRAGLDQVHFYDLENGWISGGVLAEVPRDPFFLLTRDGGKTWRSRPISEDSRPGSIDSFRFDTRTHGLAWVDRGSGAEEGNRWELYESNTGGDAWSIQQLSHLAPPKPPARPDTGWRIRPERAVYVVQNQLGARWQNVASFQVPVGECKGNEAPLPEPQPDPTATP